MHITWFVGTLLEENDVDLLREGVRVLAQTGWGPSPPADRPGAPRAELRTNRPSNGYRTRRWNGRSGTMRAADREGLGAYAEGS